MGKNNIGRLSLLVEIVRLLYIIMFVYAASIKLGYLEKFNSQITQSPLLVAFAKPISIGIPIFELTIALTLMIPSLFLFGLYAAFTLMTIFTFYIIAIMNFAERIPCSCGGILEKMGWGEHLVFNIVFVVLAGLAAIVQTRVMQHKNNLISIA